MLPHILHPTQGAKDTITVEEEEEEERRVDGGEDMVDTEEEGGAEGAEEGEEEEEEEEEEDNTTLVGTKEVKMVPMEAGKGYGLVQSLHESCVNLWKLFKARHCCKFFNSKEYVIDCYFGLYNAVSPTLGLRAVHKQKCLAIHIVNQASMIY